MLLAFEGLESEHNLLQVRNPREQGEPQKQGLQHGREYKERQWVDHSKI